MKSCIYKNSRLSAGDKRAFTLIEVLVVVAIAVILVAIMAMAVGKARAFSKEKANEALVSSIAMGLDSYKTDLGSLPHSLLNVIVKDQSNNIILDEQWYGCQILAQRLLGQAVIDEDDPDDPADSFDLTAWDGYDGYGFRAKLRGKVYGPYIDPKTPTKLIDNISGEKRPVLLDQDENPIYYYRAQVGSEPRYIYDHNPDDDSEFLDALATRFTVDTNNVVDVYAMRTDETDITDRVDLPEYLLCSKGVDGVWWPAGQNGDDDLTNLAKED